MAPDINGESMRPGLVFIGLFAVLVFVYILLIDSLGTLGTFLLQAALVAVVLGGATWFRYTKRRSGWLFFGEDANESTETDDESSDQFRKAS